MRSSGGAPVSIPRSLWLATLGVLLLAAFAVGAQDTPAPPATPAAAPTGPVLLVVVDVKPDMWDDYVALQKSDAIPALQKGVIDHRSAWRTAALGPAYSVAYLYQLTSFGVLDGDPPMRRALGADGEKAYNVKLRKGMQGSLSGTLDVVRYGGVLRSRMLVGVRGAGIAYDGLYYVNSVTHNIKRGDYTQSFSFSRDGLISPTPIVPV